MKLVYCPNPACQRGIVWTGIGRPIGKCPDCGRTTCLERAGDTSPTTPDPCDRASNRALPSPAHHQHHEHPLLRFWHHPHRLPPVSHPAPETRTRHRGPAPRLASADPPRPHPPDPTMDPRWRHHSPPLQPRPLPRRRVDQRPLNHPPPGREENPDPCHRHERTKAPRRSSRTWPRRPAIRGANYHYGRPKRDIMLPIRVTAAERAAIRAAAKWENKKVSEFIRAAIAVRAEQGFCKATRDGDQRPPESGGRVSARLYASAESPLPATRPSQVRAGASIRELESRCLYVPRSRGVLLRAPELPGSCPRVDFPAAFPPDPYPSRLRVIALQAILRPVAFPKCPQNGQNRPLRAVFPSVAPDRQRGGRPGVAFAGPRALASASRTPGEDGVTSAARSPLRRFSSSGPAGPSRLSRSCRW